MSTRATYSSECVWSLLRCKEKALPSFAPLSVGSSGFSVEHICDAVAAGVRVCAVSHLALGDENADTAAASAKTIAHHERSRAAPWFWTRGADSVPSRQGTGRIVTG
eukprot:scaffold47624_cov60-Phaeocystis_antarctica.AAC.4